MKEEKALVRRRHRRKKIAVVSGVILASLFVLYWAASFTLVHLLESEQFKRVEPSEGPFVISRFGRYEDLREKNEKFVRREISFPSGKNTLRGYDYGYELNDKKGLVIFSHGFGSNQLAYLYFAERLCDEGYEVITYDNTGTVSSDGRDMVALSNSPRDLKACLEYVGKADEYTGLDLFLIGHSWGGHAVTDVFNYDGLPAVAGVVSFSGFDYAPSMLRQFGRSEDVTINFLVDAVYPALYLYEGLKMGADGYTHAYSGINKATDTDFLIVQGTDDTMIPPDRCSIYAVRERVTNPRCRFYAAEGKDHDHVFLSAEARAYEKEIKEEAERIVTSYPADEAEKLFTKLRADIDTAKLNRLDETIMSELLAFLKA